MKNKINRILLYPCNIIGYIRLAMLAMAVGFIFFYDYKGWQLTYELRWYIAIWLFVGPSALDCIDGYFARKYGHTTNFGALLELTTDMLVHTTVWLLSGLKIAPFIIALEWSAALYVAAFSLQKEESWKQTLSQTGSRLIRYYFKPMKYNAFCEYCNLAHFALPVALFVSGEMTLFAYIMLPGLLVYEFVTIEMLQIFGRTILEQDSVSKSD